MFFVIAKQGLHRDKGFSAFFCTSYGGEEVEDVWEVGRRYGQDR